MYVDFEYTKTREPTLDLVCCSTILVRPGVDPEKKRWWLWQDDFQRKSLREYLLGTGAIFVSYAVTAEGRAFHSLGINPLGIRWIDLLIEWKQLRNHCHEFQYGWVRSRDGWRRSRPPRAGEADNTSNEETGTGLSDAIKNLLGQEIDSDHKERMRHRIIAGGPFREDEARAILEYCESDTVQLPTLHARILDEELRLIPPQAHSRVKDVQLSRGRYAADMAICEARGMPLHIPRIEAISRNHDAIAAKVIREANQVYPFWVEEKRGFVQKYVQFEQLLKAKGWDEFWPITDTKRFSTEEKVLDNFRAFPEIAALRVAKKTLGQIKWFRPDALPEFYSRVGSDGRIRPYFNPFGTQTGRNAPPAKTFVLAMSSWLRCIVSPYQDRAITGRDWSSQEFAIAAALSLDANMLEAYNSGDPYLDFAKRAEGVPQEATRASHELERELFKGTVLGVQFRMGYKKLALKLTADTKREISQIEAKTQIRFHKQVFPQYWEWLTKVENIYQSRIPICTRDGWYLFCDNPSIPSVTNCPVQGNGAAILRRGIFHCHNAGLEVIAPLHDAIYVEHNEKQTKEIRECLSACMDKAVEDILRGAVQIRGDEKTLTSRDVWVEKKGKAIYESLKEFISDETAMLGIPDYSELEKRRKGK